MEQEATTGAEQDPPAVGLPRAGEPWSQEEVEHLLQEVGWGSSVQEIAAVLGRSASAINGRLRLLVPVDADIAHTAARRLQWLREHRQDSSYDWQAVLAENTRGSSPHLWSVAQQDLVRQAWAAGTPDLAQLAARLDVSEVLLVQQMIRLGLAGSLLEVTDHLGCAPGGTVDFRRTMQLDQARYTVHVLVVLDGTGLHHVSVHPEHHLAQELGEQIVAELREQGCPNAQWQVAARQPGAIEALPAPTLGPRPALANTDAE